MKNALPLSLGVLSLTACLSACGTLSTPSQPGGTQLRALTLGDVGGKVISNLQNTSLEKYSGAQDLKNYDLLVVDGDSSNADTIKTHPLVQRALALHKPLLFVDISEDQKRNGIGRLMGFNTRGTSDGYLVVPVQTPGGRTFYHLYGTSLPSVSSFKDGEAVPPPPPGDPDAAASLFASKLAGNIRAAQNPPGGLQDDPPGIGPIQAKWVYTSTAIMAPPATGTDKKTGQIANATANFTYTLFQDLGTNTASGGIQKLVVTTDATADPGPMAAKSDRDKGWLVGAVKISNTLTNLGGSNLTWFQSGPIAQNSSSSYSSGTSFNVGFSGFTGSGGYSYNTSKSWTIDDWSVSGNISGVNTSWRFKSSNPDIDDVCKYGFECAWFPYSTGKVQSPNSLSTSQSEYHTEAAYHTDHMSTDIISVESDVDVRLDNFYIAGTYFNEWDHAYHDYVMGVSADINLGAVVPQPVAITYAYDTAPGNTTTSGSVVLPRPAIVPVQVYLRGQSTGSSAVTVPFSVTVPSGSRWASFPISINSDFSSGPTTSSVTIQSLYGTTSQKLLPLKVSSDPVAPANTMTLQAWSANAADAPAGSGWAQPNPLVRYAVSYIDGSGKELMGPYTDWLGGTGAQPLFENVPLGPSGTVARRVYRQFYSEYQNNVPGHVLNPSYNGNTILNNTMTVYGDLNW